MLIQQLYYTIYCNIGWIICIYSIEDIGVVVGCENYCNYVVVVDDDDDDIGNNQHIY